MNDWYSHFHKQRSRQVFLWLGFICMATFFTLLLAGRIQKPNKLLTLNAQAANVFPGASWQTATPEEVGMDPVKFATAMNSLPSPAVVIRHGKIVGQKGDIARTGFVQSASKSLTALIAGRLIQQGQLSYDTLVPGSDNPTKPLASYRQFMNMTSDFHLSPHSPGNHYAYNNGAVVHYGNYLKNTYFPGRSYEETLRDAYVSALGFQDPIGYRGFISGWDGGWSMSTRDLARVGYLVLRNGNWNGSQLIPSSFINDLYANQVPASATPSPDTSDAFYNETPIGTPDLPGAYSFGFWLPDKRVFGGSRSQTKAVSMSGAFGTTVHISRDTNLVIAAVNTSAEHAGGKISGASLDLFVNAIATSRIAVSSDGNDHDCDDLTATAMTIALLAKTGNAGKLVYYGHSDHIWSTGMDGACNGGDREEEMRISAADTANLWGGFNLSNFYNAKAQTTAAVSALAAQINQSSATNYLWIIGAGPMEVIGQALNASDPAKRQYVTVISHSTWNDEHAEQPGHGTWNFNELGSVLGANLLHIIDQNAGLRTHESSYSWLQQSGDPKLHWLWQRHLASGLSPDFDPSDAGMIYFLLTGGTNGGDQNATPDKLRIMLGAAPASTSSPPRD